MAWVVLVLSGICESVWAIALDKSQGFTKIVPVIVFVLGLVASMGGLSYAMRSISIGTAYTVWVGIGAAITVIYGMLAGEESVSILKIVCLVGMVACIAGLKLAH
ncbi:DMT family transporter [Bifidobacterium canis]|uniref:Ligand-binding protein SH3 n=1 Tax=Bifidobacterium canis TaxID=2610880 RepID=A0A7K1J496_9BIFI|nr:multidrug efflux SMR transporter [Bifidobacterium canis]MUH59361.1 ligand-binding protein SH3 [Bifidobacterium canis]